MMTLKHITPDGHESLVSLVSVSFDPENRVVLGHGTPTGEMRWTSGRIFVMNEHGKTVAVYGLTKNGA